MTEPTYNFRPSHFFLSSFRRLYDVSALLAMVIRLYRNTTMNYPQTLQRA